MEELEQQTSCRAVVAITRVTSVLAQPLSCAMFVAQLRYEEYKLILHALSPETLIQRECYSRRTINKP